MNRAASEAIIKRFNPEESIDWNNFNQLISKYFQVGEVVKWDSRRIPYDQSVISEVLALAKELDLIREEWGNAIGVSSWHRPREINDEVGGALDSQHIYGCAADIYDMDGDEAGFEAFLDAGWGGALGYGVASGLGFTHLDLRGGGWQHGDGEIRWWY